MKTDVVQFKEYLASLDIESEIVESSEFAATDQLQIPLGMDDQERPRYVIVLVDKELNEGTTSSEEEEDAVHLVRFLGVMPVEVKKELIPDVARMVCFVNHISEIPGFVVSEPLCSTYFFYSLVCPGGHVEPRQFISALGIIGSLLEAYQPLIEKVATGELSVDKVMSGEVEA